MYHRKVILLPTLNFEKETTRIFRKKSNIRSLNLHLARMHWLWLSWRSTHDEHARRFDAPTKSVDMPICSSSRLARRSVAAAWLWGAKGDPVARGDPVRWTRREIWAPACPRRWAMPRDRPLYRAALPPPIITGPCIRPTAVQTTTVTTARPPLTSRETTILPEVRLFVKREETRGREKGRGYPKI